MNKMKKALLLALSLAMSATLFAACGKNKGNNNSSSGSSETSSSIEDSSSSESEGSSSSVEDGSSSESEDSSSSVEDSSSSVEDSSSSESEDSSEVTPAINPFTKVINKADRENGYVVVDLEEGAALDLTDPDAVEGKVFKGWVDAEGNSITATTMPAEALTIYANWELQTHTVTIKQAGAEDVVVTFAVESDIDVVALADLDFELNYLLPEDTDEVKYTVTGIPETWALEDYVLTVEATYSNLASSVSHWDRLNQHIIDATGKINQNVGNYWDGSDNSVSVALQGEVTNDSSLATKLSFNVTKLTEEQRAATLEAWSGWKDEMWVGFKVPVGGVNLSNYELVFDMKLVNTNPDSVIAYAMRNNDGEEAAFVTGKYDNNTTYKQSNMVNLGNGWYRWTITVDCSTEAGQKADYIILSLDNTAKDIDKTQDSVAYIDNMSLVKVTYYEISLNGQVERVKEGTEYTLTEPVKEGYEFLGWVDGENNIVPTGTFKVTENVTLTATWKKLPVQAGLYMPTAFDLGEEDYVLAQFSGNPGTYNILLEGGCVAMAWDGENVGEKITTITLTEENKTATFAIYYGVDDEGLYTNGTIMMTIPAENATVLDTAIRSATFTGTEVNVTNGEEYNIKYSTTETAPAGFSKVTEITWVPSEDGWGDCKAFYYLNNSVDINNYSDVYFAVKLSQNRNCFMIEIDDTVARYHNYYGGDWLQIHLYQAEDGTWSKDFVAPGFESKGEVTGVTGANLMNLFMSTPGKLSIPRGQAKNTAGLTSIVWVTDVVLVEKPAAPAPVAPFEIPETAENTNLVSFRSYFYNEIADTSTMDKAVGFKQVKGYTIKPERWNGTADVNLGREAYNKEDNLSGYEELWFAWKTVNGKFVSSIDVTDSVWVYFHLKQNEDATWTIEVKWNDQSKTFENQIGNTIQTLIYDSGWPNNCADGAGIMIQRTGDVVLDLYSTEIMGVRKEVAPFDMTGAESILDHVWQSDFFNGTSETAYTYNGTSNGTAYTEDYTTNLAAIAAPVGFSNVTQTSWTPYYARINDKDMGNTWSAFQTISKLNSLTLTGYSDVYFAMKAGDNAKIDFGTINGVGNNFYTGGAWLYIHAHQTSDKAWTITYATADGSATPIAQREVTNVSNLVGLLAWGGANCTPRHINNKIGVEGAVVPATVYYTNVLAIAKA